MFPQSVKEPQGSVTVRAVLLFKCFKIISPHLKCIVKSQESKQNSCNIYFWIHPRWSSCISLNRSPRVLLSIKPLNDLMTAWRMGQKNSGPQKATPSIIDVLNLSRNALNTMKKAQRTQLRSRWWSPNRIPSYGQKRVDTLDKQTRVITYFDHFNRFYGQSLDFLL